MTVTAKQMKQAAETLDGLAAVNTKLEGELKLANERNAKLEAELKALGSTKTASEADSKRRLGLAKKAAAALLSSGMLSTPERAEKFASEIVDHDKALVALQKFAEHAGTVRKTATVVEDSTAQAESADAVWDRHVAAFTPSR